MLKEKYGYTLEEAINLDEGNILEIFGIKRDKRKNLENQLLELVSMKRCSKCSSILPLSEFYNNKNTCKNCGKKKHF